MLQFRKIYRSGFTLVELLAVVVVLTIVVTLAAPRVTGFVKRAEITAAQREMISIRDAFVSGEGGYIANMRGIPGFSLSYLRIGNLLIATNLYGEIADGSALMRGFRVDEEGFQAKGCAKREEFIRWSEEQQRGWRGPYLKNASSLFPRPEARRFSEDAAFAARGFFPPVAGLRLPHDFSNNDISVYGFPGEPAVLDPWGNPYVLQIPPAQAFSALTATNIPDTARFSYARIVSAGPDGVLTTPCYTINETNDWREIGVNWLDERQRRLSRQAGLIDGNDRSRRGDDLVLFLTRNDVDEGEER